MGDGVLEDLGYDFRYVVGEVFGGKDRNGGEVGLVC